ncbi:MAG: dihydroxyacetone kinase subunit DhaL [Spirochaetia bacterium]|nr:dihydroxyacetone kinase subunit DhaL [Spirochaetia bacterium]
MVTIEKVKEWFLTLSDVYSKNREYLTDLDAAIGDADHGINLDRGFSAVRGEIEKMSSGGTGAESGSGGAGESGYGSSFPEFFRSVSMTLIKTIGGASGALLGTFFLEISRTVKAEKEMDGAKLVSALKAGVEGIKKRGHAQEGDKTMLDTWIPALRAMESEAASGGSVETILAAGLKNAEEGIGSTRSMIARKGRASYLGERSIGHLDPGAVSSYMMIKAAAKTLS